MVKRNVHFVGSVPLPTTEEVFLKLIRTFPGRLKRIPDGEPGTRQTYVVFQAAIIGATCPSILRPFDYKYDIEACAPAPIQDNLRADLEAFETEYDKFALDSYEKFRSLRAKGVIPAGVRFQVCLPTAVNTIGAFINPSDQANVEPFYEAALFRAMRRIQDGIPAEGLAIQLDIALEFAMLEKVQLGMCRPWFEPVEEGILERIRRQIKAVDEKVELGLHLCYGDLGHKHFVEPRDMGKLVKTANAIINTCQHPISWIHMPVPKTRDDKAYFAPLADLRISATTEIYLGVVHANDEEGTKRRIQTAQSVFGDFGVATECGLGRTPVEELDSILDICNHVTAEK